MTASSLLLVRMWNCETIAAALSIPRSSLGAQAIFYSAKSVRDDTKLLRSKTAINLRGCQWKSRTMISQACSSAYEAEASAYAARDLKPENPDVYLLLSEIHRHTQNPSALLQDIDTYLKLAPQSAAAPQVRNLREQLVKYMEAQPKPDSAEAPKP
jgi:hypothetical protein